MDIKIRARLSAYSKVDSIQQSVDIESVPEVDIDTLFTGEPTETTVTKNEIDGLFEGEEKAGAVTKNEIDGLFATEEKTETVDKDTIDTLFDKDIEEEAESVSFAEIDSLFN